MTANIAAVFAQKGLRVGMIDTDILSPGVHALFGLHNHNIRHSLNDYLWGRCDIEEAAREVTAHLSHDIKGRLWLVPSSMKPSDITRVLREGYDVGQLHGGYQRLIEKLQLDVLLIDTHPGLNDETLLSIAVSDSLVIILRPDMQDYQGTAVTVAAARKLDVPRLMLIINKTPQSIDPIALETQVESTYGCEVAAVIPHSDEMMVLGSEHVFVMRYPDHPLTAQLRQAADKLISE